MRKAQEKEGEGLVEQDRERGKAKRVVGSAGGEAKSMHRGGMQRTLRAKQYGALCQRVHSTALYDRSLSLSHFCPTLVGAATHTSVCGHVDVIFSARSNLSIRERLYAVRRQHDAVPRNDP